MIEYIYRNESVITGKNNLEHLQTIKNFPVFFGCTNESQEKDLKADMIWKIDPNTGFIQLTKLIPLDILYMEQHVDAIGKTWFNHNINFSNYVLKYKKGDIVEIGGGSGKIANLIIEKDKNVKYTVIEPNPTFKEKRNLKILKSFFTKDFKNDFNDVTVIFSQVYEHVYKPEEFLNEISEFLSIGGKLIFAYPNLEYWFKNKFTNAINFEHTMLMTDYYVDYFLEKTGFKIIDKYNYKNHSYFYTVEKIKNKNIDIKINNKYYHYKKMFKEFEQYHISLVENIHEKIKNTESQVFLFGGHIFSQFLLMYGLNSSKITNIIDNSLLKQEKRLYGTNLIVKSPKILKNIKNPIVILKTGIYDEEIKNDIITNINKNTIFI